jgi:hypothetical protein
MNHAQGHLSHRHYKQQMLTPFLSNTSSSEVHPSTTPPHPIMGWNGRIARAQVVRQSALEIFHYVKLYRFVTVYAKLFIYIISF